jgi:signal transduction histidine kinase
LSAAACFASGVGLTLLVLAVARAWRRRASERPHPQPVMRSAGAESEERRLAAVGRMAGGVAHEFNNLLVVITGLAELALENTPPDGRVRRDLVEIRAAAEQAARLTRELLAFARSRAAEARPVVLNEQVRGLAPVLERLLGERIALRLELAEPLGAVCVEAGQLERALVDLVLNARDATLPDGGEVVVATTVLDARGPSEAGLRPGRYALLRVTDHGRGMDPEAGASVFDTVFAAREGEGRGLAFVRCLVEQAGGVVRAHSEPGKGSRVELLLPLFEA